MDARKSAAVYLSDSSSLITEKDIIHLFEAIADKAMQIHKMLDFGESLDGPKARIFWTKDMRCKQAQLLNELCGLEHQAEKLAKKML